jgi:hypothetical protein
MDSNLSIGLKKKPFTLFCFLKYFWPIPIFLFFNTQTTHITHISSGVVAYLVVSSPPATEETVAMGHEIEARQGLGW